MATASRPPFCISLLSCVCYNVFMKKFLKKIISPHHWIAVVRRQPKYVQRAYATIFAGVITSFFAFFILYTDYGFWNERYDSGSVVVVGDTISSSSESNNKTDNTEGPTPESPKEVFSGFVKEAYNQFKIIGSSSTDFFKGKEIYSSGDN